MWYEFFGYESYLVAQALYPDELELLFAAAAAEAEARNRAIAATIRDRGLIPLVYLGEDICGNQGPLVSPGLLRGTYFPHLRRSLAPLVDAGIHILWHSDGDLNPILGDLIACGADGFQGFEEDKGMDLVPLLGSTCANGQRPFVCGSVSVSTTMYGTPEAVRDDVRRMEAIAAARGGGVILSASSTIMEDTPVANIAALYACGRRC
jgi:uroporphyrinogen decarboxylase